MKYRNLKELMSAYDLGLLARSNKLVVEKHDSYVMDETGDRVFEGGDPSQGLLTQALEALRVPYDRV